MDATTCAPPGARSARALKRLIDIQHAAAELVLEKGYDGFTMDDLAARVGVSRRTLFNHVPDKASAVLGPFDEHSPDPAALEIFRAGGPHGRLKDDLVHAIDTVVATKDDSGLIPPGHHALVDRAIRTDGKVMQLVAHRFELVTAMLQDAVTAREGWERDDLRARALAATVLSLLRLTLDRLAEVDDDADFTTHFHEVLAADAAARDAA